MAAPPTFTTRPRTVSRLTYAVVHSSLLQILTLWLCEGIIGEGRSLLVFTFAFEGDDDDDDDNEEEEDDDDGNCDSNSN